MAQLHIEERLRSDGRKPADSTLAEMDRLWDEALVQYRRCVSIEGFDENRGGRFLLPTDPQPAAPTRRYPRHDLLLGARLLRLNAVEGGPAQELTVTDDIGRGGAKVRTALPIAKGELIDLEAVDRTFLMHAMVRNVTTGNDHVLRLHVEFVEALAAERVGEILKAAGIHD